MNHPGKPSRERASEQFTSLLDELDAAWSAHCRSSVQAAEQAAELAATTTARNQMAETLNQGLRRIRQAATLESTAIAAVEIAAPFAARCAVFRFGDGEAAALAARDLGPLPLTFPPSEGAAFRTCIDTQDPVIAIATPAEISASLAARVGDSASDRVFLLPLAVRGEVRFILFAAGPVQAVPLELIAGIAAIQMESLVPAPTTANRDLIVIGGTAPVTPTRQSWEDLPPDQQALHLRAQREARLRVAELRLQHSAALRAGLQQSDIYRALREPIDQARQDYRRDYIAASPTMVDYLYLELVRGLAQGNDALLGADFPGPLV